MRIDHVALLVLVLDLLFPGRRGVVLAGAAVGAAATAALAFQLALSGDEARFAFCGSACSFPVDAGRAGAVRDDPRTDGGALLPARVLDDRWRGAGRRGRPHHADRGPGDA